MSKFFILGYCLAFGAIALLSGSPASHALPPMNGDSPPLIEPSPRPGTVLNPSRKVIAAPCVNAQTTNSSTGLHAGGTSPLVTCDCLYSGTGCPSHLANSKGLFVELERRVQQYIDPELLTPNPGNSLLRPIAPPAARGLYQGVDQDFDSPDGGQTPFCNGAPICSLLPTPFSTKDGAPYSELTSNHRNPPQSCGNFRNIRVKVRKGKPALVQFFSNLPAGIGTRERAYFCGSYVAAIAHHYRLVRSEIESSNSITIEPQSGQAHACQRFAEVFERESKSYAASTQELLDQKNIKDIWNCDGDSSTLRDAAGERRVSMTHLCGTRASLIQAFTQLASCKIAANAGRDYNAQFGEPNAATNHLKRISVQINRRCDGEIRRARPRSEEALNSLTQACYEREAPAAFRSLFESLWRPYAQ